MSKRKFTISDYMQSKKEFSYYRKNPEAFIRKFVLTNCSDVVISDQQKLIINEVASKKRSSFSTGRGLGKGADMAWLTYWFQCVNVYDTKVIITSPSQAQMKSVIWPELKKWLIEKESPLRHIFEYTESKLKYTGNERVVNFAEPRTASKSNPESMSGLHADNLLIMIDEASAVHDDIYTKVLPTLSGPNNKVALFSNPTRLSGTFYDTHNKKSLQKFWHSHIMSTEHSPHASSEQIQAIIETSGRDSDDFKINVSGEFPSGESNTVFTYDEIQASMNKVIAPVDDLVIGVDVARFGGDRTVITPRAGMKVYTQKKFVGQSTTKTRDCVYEAANELRKATGFFDSKVKVYVETNGVGGGLMDMLAEDRIHNILPIEIVNTAKSFDKCVGTMTQFWWNVRENYIHRMELPNDDHLAVELYTRTYGYSDNGKIKLQPKQKYKDEHNGKSPDLSDSLMITFGDIEELNKVVKGFDWLDKKIIRNIHQTGWQKKYTSLWYHHATMTYNILTVGWNGNRMYVLNEYQTDDDLEAVKYELNCLPSADYYIGNSELFSRSTYDDLAYRLMMGGFYFVENKDYQEANAAEFLSKMVKENRIIINETCTQLVDQLRFWTPDGSQKDKIDKFSLCYALSNIVSHLREQFYQRPVISRPSAYGKYNVEKGGTKNTGRDASNAFLGLI